MYVLFVQLSLLEKLNLFLNIGFVLGVVCLLRSNVSLFIDAEHLHLQPAVRAITLATMKRFNTGTKKTRKRKKEEEIEGERRGKIDEELDRNCSSAEG